MLRVLRRKQPKQVSKLSERIQLIFRAQAMNTLHRQMALLTSSNERMIAEVGQLKNTYRGGSRTNAASCERNHLNMFHGLNDEGVCWYHAAWASNARKSVNGCRQGGNDHAGR